MHTFCRQASPADLIALVQFSTGSKCYSKNSTELKNVGRFVQLRPFQNVVVFVVLSDNRISDPLTVMLIPISTACDLRFHMPCYDPARMTGQETVAPLRMHFYRDLKKYSGSKQTKQCFKCIQEEIVVGCPYCNHNPQTPRNSGEITKVSSQFKGFTPDPRDRFTW